MSEQPAGRTIGVDGITDAEFADRLARALREAQERKPRPGDGRDAPGEDRP